MTYIEELQDMIRHRYGVESVHLESVPVKETPESVLLQSADRQLVQEALGRLALPYREVLLLCEFEEMSYQEISATLGIPMGTVMSRLSRARRALRESVQQLQRT